jgi:hypothetical protein
MGNRISSLVAVPREHPLLHIMDLSGQSPYFGLLPKDGGRLRMRLRTKELCRDRGSFTMIKSACSKREYEVNTCEQFSDGVYMRASVLTEHQQPFSPAS